MSNRVKYFLLLIVMLTSIFGLTSTQHVNAATSSGTGGVSYGSGCDFSKTFFGLPVWYKYLQAYQRNDAGGACSFDFDKSQAGNTTVDQASAFVLIGLAAVDILLRLVGIIAVGFVIYGGVRYVLSQGSPDQTKAARSTIINALIGAVIATVASGVVGFIGNKLG